MTLANPNPITMERVTDPVELAKSRAQDERAKLNWAWRVAHATELIDQHRGKVLCVAGQELFVADTTGQVLSLARAAHPEDDGLITWYVPKERAYRIYAN